MELKGPTALLNQDPIDLRLVCAIQSGLPLVPRPYAGIAAELGITESEVIARLKHLLERGDIRRFGVVVRHRELGYRANAMVVWDVPDERVSEIGRLIGRQACVTLCYRRPRRPGRWRYNLFCMIHGRSREGVLRNLEKMVEACDLAGIEHEVLFSLRRFKQRGARYDVGREPPRRRLDRVLQGVE
ncbi:MAG: AsnC family protein [Candidatus Thiodiazotropha sp. (ex Dulcina madagascariensis)]|nr:AsnC family protein [Candidatus Thiodiazotropha sp. (ex Dulcina madagascariensis)]MCU7927470.1 AsnC family protein [Candidatus Thiodiazotropha sp. (ex Dulcina madagascariensis)]MCU7936648.1 AsnC family protein [Candidatus Thiodiazotropha sp. (ex Dulcina madagascariensis)]